MSAMDAASTIFDKASLLAPGFAERAPLHDRTGGFPFENSQELADAGLLALTVPKALCGAGRGVRDWVVEFLNNRVPSGLGAPLATLSRVQQLVGGIQAKLTVNARLLDSFARDIDDGVTLTASEANIVKLTVTNNAVAAVEEALSLTSNHGLSRTKPLERHLRDVMCGRVYTPQDDATRISAGRLALGI